MKGTKTYKFNNFGYAQAILDIRKGKKEKIDNITSLAILIVFCGLGFMSKDYFILYATGKGVSFITNLITK